MSTETLLIDSFSAKTPSFDSRRCPACGGELSISARPHVQSHPCAESLSFEQLKSMWYGFFKEKAFFSYFRCPQCSILYCKNYFSTAQLDQLYNQMPDNTAGVSL